MLCPNTNDGQEYEKKFYHQLHEITAIKKKVVIIVMGDMNAKIESNNEGSERVMGRHGIGNMTENGELFSELCARRCDLVIGGK
jgi:exonuclease III